LLPVKGTPLKLAGDVRLSGPMLSGKRLRVARDTLKFVASDWTLDLSGTPAFKGNVTVDGLSLPLPGTRGGVPGDLGDLTAQGHLRIVNLDFYGIPVEEAQADAVLKGGVASFANMRMQGASVLASGRMTAGTAGLLSFDTEFSLKGVSISKLLERYSPNQDFIRGNINLDGRLSGGNDSINGTVKLSAKDGRLKRYALISRVFAVLNVYKIIKSRDLELTSKNFPYNQIAGTFVIKDSVARFDDFFLDSNSLQFSAVGSYSLRTGTVDAILGVQPFESLDRTIRAIPLIGWVLTGDKGQLFIVSLKVTGKIDDPGVTFQPVKTVSDPVKESLIRALKLPSELLKDSRDLLRGKKGS
ncbi:MAG TPA: AsmA-like C-terminal domain-containing protein, partial [Deltaproteobacteria bacterium]|nr:AsmA-like C-terminal domain-containing protein [Deltaproteobacteria bacterium]